MFQLLMLTLRTENEKVRSGRKTSCCSDCAHRSLYAQLAISDGQSFFFLVFSWFVVGHRRFVQTTSLLKLTFTHCVSPLCLFVNVQAKRYVGLCAYFRFLVSRISSFAAFQNYYVILLSGRSRGHCLLRTFLVFFFFFFFFFFCKALFFGAFWFRFSTH